MGRRGGFEDFQGFPQIFFNASSNVGIFLSQLSVIRKSRWLFAGRHDVHGVRGSLKMKFIAIAAFFAFCATLSSADEAVNEFVLNGQDADIRDHPYMAQVWTLVLPLCGGAILTQRSVLTVSWFNLKLTKLIIFPFQAAHCLIARISQPVAVTIIVGSSYRRGDGGQRHAALRIILHPNYDTSRLINDVAIVRTVGRITYGELVQPIALASQEYIEAGETGVFTGWGVSTYRFLPRYTELLQKMYIRTISNDVCEEMYSITHRGPYVVEQKLCILSGPRTSVCSGDSGSPVIIDGKVAGVLSWRTMPCGDGLPDVFIRVSVVREWILSNIWNVEISAFGNWLKSIYSSIKRFQWQR